MPRFLITAPDGTKYQLDGPDGSTADDALKIIQAQHPASHNPVADMPSMDPSAGGSTLRPFGIDTGIKTPEWLDRGLSGVGKAMTDLGQGAAQTIGAASRKDVAESRKLDAPLAATTGGKVGELAGNLVMMAPSIAIPGGQGAGFLAATRAAATTGAALGFLQPSTSTGETLSNAALGGAVGGVTPALGRGLQAVGNYATGYVAPLFAKGQEGIAGRALLQAAGSPQAATQAANALKAAAPAVSGVQPTMGMVSKNGGLAQLQRAVANNPDAAAAFSARDQTNSNALLDAVRGIAGAPGQREFFAADRDAAAKVLYGRARANYDPSSVTPEMQSSIDSLLKRPSITQGSKDAQRIAMEDGRLPSSDGSFASLEDVGHSLDDQISALNAAGQKKLAGKVTQTKNQLLDLMDNLSPDHKEARATYAEMSKPINRMDVGQALLDKLSSAMNDFGIQKQLRPTSFAEALAAGDATAKKATGFSGAKMDQILSPEDMKTLQGVGQTLGQVRDAQTLGKAVGSNTAQNQISQDALRQIAGPLGLPQGFAENALMQTLMRPQQFVGKLAEPKITELLQNAALNPQAASALMLKQLAKTDDPKIRNALARALLLGGRTTAETMGQ